MRPASNLEIELQTAGGGDLKMTGVPGVFRMRHPMSPKGLRRVAEIKRNILLILSRAFPYCASSLDASDADLLATIGRSLPATGDPEDLLWVVLRPNDLDALVPMLHRGAWGLFFASSATLSSEGPTKLTFDDEEARDLTRRVGANASVISWYDDLEWLICAA